MDRNDFLKILNNIENGIDIARTFIIDGDENYIKKDCVKKFVSKLVDENFLELNYNKLNKVSLSDIYDYVNSYPLMSKFRVVCVENYKFSDEDLDKKNKDSLYTLITSVPDSCKLIFFYDNAIDKRSKLYKNFSEYIYSFSEFTKDEAANWLCKHLKNNSKKITLENALNIVLSVGHDISLLKQEASKLIDYCDKTEIGKDDIDKIISKSLNFSVFSMNDAFFEKNMKKALLVERNLIKNGENEYMIFSILLRDIKNSYYIKTLSESNYNISKIAQICGTMDFVVRKKINALRNIKISKLKKAYLDCINIDLNMKEGNISQNGIVEKTLLNLYNIFYT